MEAICLSLERSGLIERAAKKISTLCVRNERSADAGDGASAAPNAENFVYISD